MRKWILSAVALILVASGFLLSINGFEPHPYQASQLEPIFLQKAADEGLSLDEGYELIQKEHGNSKIYLMKDVNGKSAGIIYVMTPLSGKYKIEELWLQVENMDSIVTEVNDGLMKYDITLYAKDGLQIEGGYMKNVLTAKLFTMSFAIVLIVGATLFAYAKEKAANRFS